MSRGEDKSRITAHMLVRLAPSKYLREHLDRETDPVERHFMFNELEVHLYKARDAFSSALAEYEEVCVQHDSEMETIRPILVERLGGVPALPTYKQMAIMKQKQHDYAAALDWAERGLALCREDSLRTDHVKDLEKRADRYRVKLR